ncbi:efflux RND transporter permease subunit [Chitinivorax sp. PXF-14]|uniref:efflux RND transporter permease subunit n=1 Tax=Chitinivorax sp. PXF-14 TaxID=3230488 RepID=UPI0034658D63
MGISGRIAKLFLQSQLTPLIALVALLLGLFAVWVTPKEEEPQINVTMANVFIPFPGASAKDVEALVATPAEQVLAQIQGLDHVYSVSRPGLAVLTVQYKVGVSRETALVRLWDAIHANRDWVSAQLGVGEPIIKAKGIDDVPIVALTLSTADAERGAFDLERVAHALEVELKRVPGTREVSTIGGPGRKLRVLLDADKLAAFGVSALEIQQALQLSNIALPAGSLVRDNQQVEVETGNYLENARDVASLVVGMAQGNPVYLSDVARIVDGPDQPVRYVWSGAGAAAKGAGGEQPAVTLAITKKPGENAVDVAHAVLARVAELRGAVIPDGVEVTVTRNYGETANDKAMKLIQKLAFATLSVVALVFMALGRREAVIVGGAVILTLAATLFASWAWGFTLNRVSLFALIFSIGILVDDAIVVVENIHRHRQLEPGKPLAEIIPAAVDEVGGPTILATFTVIAALLPMAFVSGLMGPYMSPIPINSSLGMVISLAIAFIVTPWLALRLTGKHAAVHGAQEEAAQHGRLMRLFTRIMSPFLDDSHGRRQRHKLYLGIVVAIVLSVSLAGFKLVVMKMLPFDNKSEFQVVVDMPAGTPLEQTAAVLHELGAEVARVPEVTDYQAYAGTAAPINFNGLVRQYYLRQAAELGDLQVNLLDKHHRSRKSHEIAQQVRPALEKIAARHGAKLKVVEVPPGPPVMSPIVAEVYGPDEAGRIAVTKRLREHFRQTADIVAIDDSVEDAAPKLRLKVDQAKAAQLGVAQRDIVATMRVGLNGSPVTPLHDGQAKYEVPVTLTLPPERQSNLDELLKLAVKAQDGTLVPLSELVRVQPASHERALFHKDLLPLVYVMGDMAGRLDSPLYGMFAIRGAAVGEALPEGGRLTDYFIRQPSDPYRGYAIKWDGEWQVTYETFRDMGIAYGVGLILIYLLVVAQFKSYLTPAIIMAPIPLTVIGVMPGHALLGAQFTATSMIGMIALAGIIVRNSILLVDFIKLQLAAGMAFKQAVIEAAATRAKPIVLTGVAAMMGAFFILDDPIFNGLAISLIFGILVSTVLTLVLIPLLYYAAYSRRPDISGQA